MKQKNDELVPMNEDLHSEFSIHELEERLETDPLFLSNILNVQDSEQGAQPRCLIACKDDSCLFAGCKDKDKN